MALLHNVLMWHGCANCCSALEYASAVSAACTHAVYTACHCREVLRNGEYRRAIVYTYGELKRVRTCL